jgi:hypothetical protein
MFTPALFLVLAPVLARRTYQHDLVLSNVHVWQGILLFGRQLLESTQKCLESYASIKISRIFLILAVVQVRQDGAPSNEPFSKPASPAPVSAIHWIAVHC